MALSTDLGMGMVTFRSSTVFPMVCLGPIVMSSRPQGPVSKKLMFCFTYTGMATRLRREANRLEHGENKANAVTEVTNHNCECLLSTSRIHSSTWKTNKKHMGEKRLLQVYNKKLTEIKHCKTIFSTFLFQVFF